MATYREQIKQFFAKTFKGWYIEVTRPKKFLLDCGIPNLPIVIKPTTLKQKIEKHNLTKDDLQSLNTLINSALIVFHSPSEGKYYSAFNIITERKDEKGFLCVVVYINEEINRVEINNIASIHYRNINSIIKWVEEGYLINSNIEKIRKVFSGSLHNASKFEYLVSLLDAANIQNNSLSGAKADTFYQSVMDKYKKRSRLEKDWIRLGLTREKEYIKVSPFPSDWERVINQEIAQKVKDGDIFGQYRENYEHKGTNKFIKKYYRVYTAPNGDLYYYEIDEEGNTVYMNETNEKSYLSRKDEWDKLYNLRIEQANVNGKVRLYFGNKATAHEHQYFSIFIKPRTTATNSRLRLLKIQAQAKIKLQQQRMREAGVSGTELIYF